MAKINQQQSHEKQNLRAVIASFPNTPLDETQYALAVSNYIQSPATVVNVQAKKGIEQLPEALYVFEELYITSPIPMLQTYAAAREQGVLVCVDGHGADELFCGYDTFMFHAFLDCGANPYEIRRLLQTYRALSPSGVAQFAKAPVSYKNYLQWICHYQNWQKYYPYLRQELRKVWQNPKPHRRHIANITQATAHELGHLNAALYHLFHTQNLPTLLRNYDHYSMANGVEIRMPFLDHRLVSYAFSLPYTSKIRGGFTKAILRDAVSPFTPKKVIRRRSKMGFQTPIVNWLQGAWKPYFLAEINSREFKESTIIEPIAVKKALETVIFDPKARYRQGELAYAAISPYLWYKYAFKRMRNLPKVQDYPLL
jgi:asparagine synthase (glutamine-hydrolysing)